MIENVRRLLILSILAGALLVLMMIPQWILRQMIYPAPPHSVPATAPAPLRAVEFEGITGWMHSGAGNTALLYFHGNGENLQTMHLSGIFDELRLLDTSFLAVDYPGYGRSQGSPSESDVLRSAETSAKFLRQSFPDKQLILCGWSLGASVAVLTAALQNTKPDALIAISAWTSLPDVARLHFPKWLVQPLLRERYDSLEAAARIQCPVLLLHGENDTLIPMTQGEQLASRLGKHARWMPIPNAGHNDLLGQPEVWTKIKAFLSAAPNF